MCGISAIINNNKIGPLNNISTIKNLLKSLKHRGPDNSKYITNENITMGMTRLSIIDIEKGNQPMQSECGRYTIIFNGEIYNYRFLRNILINKNIKFNTNSDTELLLNGYIYWQDKIVELIEGMFVFIIFDSLTRLLWMCRDRLGKKPLYYYTDSNCTIFSSEVRSIKHLKHINLSINEQSYWDYLTYRYIPLNNTSYNEIKSLPPATILKVSNNHFKYSSYWSKKFADGHKNENKNKLSNSKQFSKIFSNSVKKRLISDVPVGVVLSGGLDSSAILYEASKFSQLNSYHVYFKSNKEEFNELKYAKKVADYNNSYLQVVEINDKIFIDSLNQINNFIDEPLSDLSSIPFKHVCDLASKDVKVVLSGEGSDEILAGYGLENVLKNLHRLSFINKFPNISSFLVYFLKLLFSKNLDIYKDKGISFNEWPAFKKFNITNQIDNKSKISLLNNIKRKNFNLNDSIRILDNAYSKVINEDAINQILHVISEDWLVQNVLMKSDKVSMSSSLELRCPFLDHELVDFMFRVHGDKKINYINFNLENKYLLKKYMLNKLPREIVLRKKLGFPVPAYEFKDALSKDFAIDILSSKNCFYRNFFDKNKILEFFKYSIDNDVKNNLYFMWSIIIYEIWYRKQ